MRQSGEPTVPEGSAQPPRQESFGRPSPGPPRARDHAPCHGFLWMPRPGAGSRGPQQARTRCILEIPFSRTEQSEKQGHTVTVSWSVALGEPDCEARQGPSWQSGTVT